MTAVVEQVPPAVRAAACDAAELPGLVQQLLGELVEAVPAASSASLVTVAAPRGGAPARLRPWATSGPAGHDLDVAQAAAGQGPAHLATTTDDVVVSADVAADPRWVLPPVPAGPVVVVPLPGAAAPRAVLVVQGDAEGGAPDLTDPAAVARVGALVPDLAAAVAVVQARSEAAHLQLALASNRTIGAAIGVAMASRKLPYDEAAHLLRSLSNHTNTRLVDLAEQVLLTGELPVPPPPTVPATPRPRPPGGAAGGR